MVTSIDADDERNIIIPGTGYDGVVRISIGGSYGTGSLLYDGQAILTSAHLVDGKDLSAGTVFLETSTGPVSFQVAEGLVHPDYDPVNNNFDLALLWLTDSVGANVDRYALHHDPVAIGQSFTMVGYGRQGTGLQGVSPQDANEPVLLKAQNTIGGDAAELKLTLGATMGWSPAAGSLWVSDFDRGFSSEDALGEWLSIPHTGLGLDEGLIAPGDSGGPAFIDGQIAGVASYVAGLSTPDFSPDVDNEINSSFGELGFWQKVDYFDDWIDRAMRAHYPDAPTSAAEVQKTLVEGDEGTALVYFLVEFHGTRESDDQVLSIDYRTLAGTATAGQDYISTQGRLLLYEDEYRAVIPVEVIGDTVKEPDEFFYLEISNPVGGTFPDNASVLTAQRNIFDDDWA